MSESTHALKQAQAQKTTPDPGMVREALLMLRKRAAKLPPVDAVAIVRGIPKQVGIYLLLLTYSL